MSQEKKAMAAVLSPADFQNIHSLWNELAEFPPTQTDQAQLHLMKTLCRWIDADNARWHAGIRLLRGAPAKSDSMLGWRIQGTRSLLPRTARQIEVAQGFHRIQKGFDVGMTVQAIAAEAGERFRLHRLRDGFIDFDVFRKTAYYQAYYRDFGISDRMWACFPLNSETEALIVLDRYVPCGRFTNRHAALIETVWRGMRWFHRQLLLSLGVQGAQTLLSPGKRRVVQELLTGKQEKEIAAALGHSVATTHQYVKSILLHYGVNSRAALLALWLGTHASKPTTPK